MDDDDDDTGVVGQDEIGPSQLQVAPQLSRHSSHRIDGVHVILTLQAPTLLGLRARVRLGGNEYYVVWSYDENFVMWTHAENFVMWTMYLGLLCQPLG